MLIVHVHIQVKPDQVDAFQAASIENSRNSVKNGSWRFCILWQRRRSADPGARIDIARPEQTARVGSTTDLGLKQATSRNTQFQPRILYAHL